MTDPIDDGGPADGMSQRDFFAAAALTGLLASNAIATSAALEAAEVAYAMADAMLAERARDQP